MKILLIDDEEQYRRILGDSLRNSGNHEVIEAASYAAAIECMEKHPEIRWVITDLNLDGKMTGLDVLLKAKEMFPKCKGALTSLRLRPEPIADARSLGFLAFEKAQFPEFFTAQSLIKRPAVEK